MHGTVDRVEREWADAAKARLGTTLSERWRLDAVLGIGGMSAVYAATHRNGNRVAIKVMRPELAANATSRARLVREAYAANKLVGKGGVTVLDDGVDGDAVFLVMELLHGQTLRERASSAGGRLSIDDALDLGEQMLEVLAAAHDAGIIHRDIKPENVFVTREGDVRVLDFGLAHMADEASPAAALTPSHATLGTPAYMAPEQAWMRDVDARSDLWAAGATLFALLTGRHVREAKTSGEMLILAGTQHAPPIGPLLPELSPAVARVIDRALAFAQSDRWQDTRSMLAALREARGRTSARTEASARSIAHAAAPMAAATAASPSAAPRDLATPETTSAESVVMPRASSAPTLAKRRTRGTAAAAFAVLAIVSVVSWQMRRAASPKGTAATATDGAPAPTSAAASASPALPAAASTAGTITAAPAATPSAVITPSEPLPASSASARPRRAPPRSSSPPAAPLAPPPASAVPSAVAPPGREDLLDRRK